MLLFFHRWDYCWKCEFDINAKVENYYHHDGEQSGFYEKVHIKTQIKKDVLVMGITKSCDHPRPLTTCHYFTTATHDLEFTRKWIFSELFLSDLA